jgi:DNA-binding protein H-NS
MATYHELKALLADLARQAEEAKAVEVQALIDDIRAKVAEYGLTEKDIFGRQRRAQAKRAFTGIPQYRDPKTGAEWTGHGRAPGWIKDVKDRTKFLIAGASDEAAVSAGAVAEKAAAKKVVAKKAASKAAVGKKTAAKRAATKAVAKKGPGRKGGGVKKTAKVTETAPVPATATTSASE